MVGQQPLKLSIQVRILVPEQGDASRILINAFNAIHDLTGSLFCFP
jgi:hypothetical protein